MICDVILIYSTDFDTWIDLNWNFDQPEVFTAAVALLHRCVFIFIYQHQLIMKDKISSLEHRLKTKINRVGAKMSSFLCIY